MDHFWCIILQWYELFTSTLNNKTSFTAWGSLAVLKGSWWFFLSWSESDWVRYPHSSMLHYAYSTWIMKIMAKRVNCLQDYGFVLKYRTPATIRNVGIARWENLLLKILWVSPSILNYLWERFGQKINQLMQKDKWKWSVLLKYFANPLNPMSDQNRVSPYNITTVLSRKVMQVYQNIN